MTEEGKKAIESLVVAKESLFVSTNLSLLSIYGGYSLIFQRIENVRKSINLALENLMALRDELNERDEMYALIDEEINTIDHLSEDINEDFFIQARIKEAQNILDKTIKTIEVILS